MSEQKKTKSKWLKYLPALLIALVVIGAIFLGSFLMKFLHQDAGPQKKMVQQITVLTPPPPPPPPPPQPEQIKEPELKEEPIKAETDAPPKDAADDAPAQEASEGAALGNDAFGQRQNTGRGWGPGGGGGYEQTVRMEINEFITENARLKHMDYVAVLTLKISESGEFEQFEVDIVNGDKEAGDLIRKILKDKRKLSKPRPLEAASVVKLRIKSVL